MIGLAFFWIRYKKRKFTHQDLGSTPLIQQYQIRIYQQLVYLWLKLTPLGFHHQRSEFEISYLTKGH